MSFLLSIFLETFKSFFHLLGLKAADKKPTALYSAFSFTLLDNVNYHTLIDELSTVTLDISLTESFTVCLQKTINSWFS
jgi:hypothetical protein